MNLKFTPITTLTIMNTVTINFTYVHGPAGLYYSSGSVSFCVGHPEDIQVYVGKLKEVQSILQEKYLKGTRYPEWLQEIYEEGLSVIPIDRLSKATIPLDVDYFDSDYGFAMIESYQITYHDRFGHKYKVEEE